MTLEQQTPATPTTPATQLRWQLATVGCFVAAAVGCLVLTQALGKPTLAAALAIGVAAIPALLRHQSWILVLLGVAEVANLGAIAAEHGAPKLVAALLAVALVGLLARWPRDRVAPPWSPVLWFAAAFFATRLVSILAATDSAASVKSLTDLAQDLVFFAIVYALCVQLGAEGLLAKAVVVTAAALCLLELVQQFVLGNSTTFFGLSRGATVVDVGLTIGRHSGPLDDFNFWGRVLVMIAPLALALFANRSSGRRRWWWLVAFLLIASGVYLTGSRGALLVLVVVLVAWCLLAGRQYRRLLLLAPVVAAVLLVLPGVGSRLASITDVSTTSSSQADLSLTGRVAVQEIGAHMFLEHPAIGVGVGNFRTVEPLYQRHYAIEGPILAPHNLYLEMAAESGLLGLAGWLGLYGCGLFVVARARLLTRQREPSGMPDAGWLLTGGVIAGLLGWGLTSVLLHMGNFRVFALILAIAAAADVRARRQAATREGATRWRPDMLHRHIVPKPDRILRPERVVAALVFVAATGMSLLIPGVLSKHWSASTELQLAAASDGKPADAYDIEVSSRGGLVLTYLSLLGNDYFRQQAADTLALSPAQRAATTVTASTTTPPGVLTVTGTGTNPEAAAAMAKGVADTTAAYVNGLHPFYELHEVPSAIIKATSTTAVRPDALGFVLIIAAANGTAGWVIVRNLRRPGHPGRTHA